MSYTIQITSVNYNGQGANITFYSSNAPDVPVNLGLNAIPYTRTGVDVFGRYVLSFPAFGSVCEVSIAPPTTTTSTTLDPSITTTTVEPSSLYLPPMVSSFTGNNTIMVRNMNLNQFGQNSGGFVESSANNVKVLGSALLYNSLSTLTYSSSITTFSVKYLQSIGGPESSVNNNNSVATGPGAVRYNSFNFPNYAGFSAPTGTIANNFVTVFTNSAGIINLLARPSPSSDYIGIVFLERSLDGNLWDVVTSQAIPQFWTGVKNANSGSVGFSTTTSNYIFRARVIGQTNNFPDKISTSPWVVF